MCPELKDGVPVLSLNHGSGTLTLRLPPEAAITDRRWHRLDITSDGKVGGASETQPLITFDLNETGRVLSRLWTLSWTGAAAGLGTAGTAGSPRWTSPPAELLERRLEDTGEDERTSA